MLSLVEQVELIEPTGYQKGDVIEYPENDGGAKAYVMWDIVEADIFGRQHDPKGMVEVFIN